MAGTSVWRRAYVRKFGRFFSVSKALIKLDGPLALIGDALPNRVSEVCPAQACHATFSSPGSPHRNCTMDLSRINPALASSVRCVLIPPGICAVKCSRNMGSQICCCPYTIRSAVMFSTDVGTYLVECHGGAQKKVPGAVGQGQTRILPERSAT